MALVILDELGERPSNRLALPRFFSAPRIRV
jgi:hypothetical protein